MELENTQNGRRKRRSPAISFEQRQEFYRMHYADKQTFAVIAKKFDVSIIAVKVNIAKFAQEIKDAYERTEDMSKLSDSERIKALEKENKELRAQVAESELKARFFETMVDIAEKKFNIPIKKKAGTQPPEP